MKQTTRPTQPTANELTAKNVRTILQMEKAAAVPTGLSDRIAHHITRFCGSMSFLWLHVISFGGWIVGNVALGTNALDPFPFLLLSLIVSVEAIFLSTFILISENRQARVDERRSHLDLQINLLAEQENTQMLRMLLAITHKLGISEGADEEMTALEERTRPEQLAEQIDASMKELEK